MAFVFSNLAISLDGKISTSDRSIAYLGTEEDRAEMLRLRREADCVVFGASTLRTSHEAAAADPHFPANAVVSHKLDGVDPTWPFFTEARTKRFLFVSGQPPSKLIKQLSGRAEIVELKDRAPIAKQIVDHLSSIGHERILVEGGGELMWEFVRENLINEYHITLTPKIIGGKDAPSLVQGKGFGPGDLLNLKLTQMRAVGEELFLIYRPA